MKLINAIGAVTAIGLAVVVWNLVDASGNEASVQHTPGDADRVAALEDRVEQLSRSANSAHVRVNQLASRPTFPVRRDRDGDEATEPAGDDDPVGHDDAIPVEVALEESFNAEASDTEWTRSAPAEAEDALRELLPAGSQLGDVDCRGSLCRVEIRYDGEQGHAAFVQSLMQSQPRWTGPGSYTRVAQPDGSERTVAFLGEPGSDLVAGSVWQVDAPR